MQVLDFRNLPVVLLSLIYRSTFSLIIYSVQ